MLMRYSSVVLVLLTVLQFDVSFTGHITNKGSTIISKAPSYDDEVCEAQFRFFVRPSTIIHGVINWVNNLFHKHKPKPSHPHSTSRPQTLKPGQVKPPGHTKPPKHTKPPVPQLPDEPPSFPKGCQVLQTSHFKANQYEEFYPLVDIGNVSNAVMTLKFEIRSKSGGQVFLSAEKLSPETTKAVQGWLIDLSADSIVSSYIHVVRSVNEDYSVNTDAVAYKRTPKLVLKKHYSGFWISLTSDRSISFGRKCENEPIISYSHHKKLPVRDASFSSKSDSDAEWIFGCSEDIISSIFEDLEAAALEDSSRAAIPDATAIPDAIGIPDATAIPDATVIPDATAIPDVLAN